MNQFFGSIALWPAEQILNQIIKSDDYIAEQLAPYAGKNIEVIAQSPQLNLMIRIEHSRLSLSALDSASLAIESDANIEGKVGDLLELLTLDPDKRPLANPAIRLSGDVHLINDLFQTIQSLDIDWQDYLAPLIGDVATNQASTLGDNARNWANQARSSLQRNLEDYLKEEKRLVPHRNQIDHFDNELDNLKLKIDRMKARAEHIVGRIDRLSN